MLSLVPDPLEYPRDRALPVKWEGERVKWNKWSLSPTTSFDWHHGPVPCERCGSKKPPNMCLGSQVRDHWNLTHTVKRVETLQVLYCFRCPDCGLDQVLDGVMEEFWTLTDADYGPDGFHDRREIQDTLF